MGKTRFEIAVEPEKITATGGDRVEMRISPNPGEPLKPLNAIASGGEISRVMLALKAVSADEYGVGAMVFDEIDTGVSGRMAQAVGEKMAMIAGKRQVLCVTHLPQIAALADRHFVVEKTQVGERTGSTVRALDEEGRAQEIARPHRRRGGFPQRHGTRGKHARGGQAPSERAARTQRSLIAIKHRPLFRLHGKRAMFLSKDRRAEMHRAAAVLFNTPWRSR